MTEKTSKFGFKNGAKITKNRLKKACPKSCCCLTSIFSDFWFHFASQVGSKFPISVGFFSDFLQARSNMAPRASPGCPESATRAPKSAQDHPEAVPRASQDRPKNAQECPSVAQEWPKSTQERSFSLLALHIAASDCSHHMSQLQLFCIICRSSSMLALHVAASACLHYMSQLQITYVPYRSFSLLALHLAACATCRSFSLLLIYVATLACL